VLDGEVEVVDERVLHLRLPRRVGPHQDHLERRAEDRVGRRRADDEDLRLALRQRRRRAVDDEQPLARVDAVDGVVGKEDVIELDAAEAVIQVGVRLGGEVGGRAAREGAEHLLPRRDEHRLHQRARRHVRALATTKKGRRGSSVRLALGVRVH
tara:strand:- start:3 stop:464 length:462 start_codon:yes stop_codon:yes gene_type:complete